MKSETIPQLIYQDEECYRTICYPPYIAFLGCGFMNKIGYSIDWDYGEYPHFAWVYVLRGSGVLMDNDGNKHNIEAGMAFIRRTDRKMALTIDPKSQWAECFLSLKFCKSNDKELISRLTASRTLRTSWTEDINQLDDSTPEVLEFLHALPREGVIYNHGLDRTLINRFSDICVQLKICDIDQPANMILKCISLIESFTRKEQLSVATSASETMRRITKILSSNLQNRTAIPQLLDGSGLGYSRIRSTFKTTLGISPGEFRIQRRIEEAGRLLQFGTSIKEVSTLLGYTDQFTFATQFKKYTGMTPTIFTKSR